MITTIVIDRMKVFLFVLTDISSRGQGSHMSKRCHWHYVYSDCVVSDTSWTVTLCGQ